MSDPRRQRLDSYTLPVSYSAGAAWLTQLVWFCLASPLVALRCLPGSLWRCCVLRSFGAQIGVGCRIKPGLRVKYPWRLQVGCHCWLGEDVWIDNLAPIRLGDQVCLSQGVYLCTGNHNYATSDFSLICKPIQIDSGAWIGAQACLAPGVTIGSDAVVSLGSVVIQSVEPATVVAGNPAQLLRSRWR